MDAPNYKQGFEVSGDDFSSKAPSKFFDDDGRPKRTGKTTLIRTLYLSGWVNCTKM